MQNSIWNLACKKLALSYFMLQLPLSPLLFAESAWSFSPDLQHPMCQLIIDQETSHLYCANGRSFHCYNHHPRRVWFRQDQRFLAVSHGKVYSCSPDGMILFCHTTQGEELWRNHPDFPIKSIAVNDQGLIYLLSTNYELVIYDPEHQTSIDCCAFLSRVCAMKLDAHHTLYCSCENGDLYCAQSDGSTWKVGSALHSLDCLAIGTDHTIYCGSKEGFIYCFSLEGALLHRFVIGKPVSDITIDAKNNLYLATSDYWFYYVDLQKRLLLQKLTKDIILGTALLDNKVYFYSNQTVHHLVVTDATLKSWIPSSLQEDPEETLSDEEERSDPTAEDSADPLAPLKDKMADLRLTFYEYEILNRSLNEYPSFLNKTLNKCALKAHEIKFCKLTPNGLFTRTPLFGPDGRLYLFSIGGLVSCYRDNQRLWEVKGILPSTPFTPVGDHYFASIDNRIICLAPDRIFIHHHGKQTSQSMIDRHGFIYFIDDTNTLFRTPVGSTYPSWSYSLKSPLTTAPISDPSENVYIATSNGKLSCIDHNEVLVWELKLPKSTVSNLSFDRFGNIYAQSAAQDLYCISPAGDLLWSDSRPGETLTLPIITATQHVYLVVDQHQLICLNKDGKETWSYLFPKTTKISAPVIDTAGNCYFGTDSGQLYCLDQAGQLIWKCDLGLPVIAPPIMSPTEEIFLLLSDHSLISMEIPKNAD
ncbi:MAG: PQQ-binding-like beta-propeller repeat protein [Chlamydiota bacterium]